MIKPIRQQANVFMALDSWAKMGVEGVRVNGTRVVPEEDVLPNHTLPMQLLRLFRPLAIEWGHASETDNCEGGSTSEACAFDLLVAGVFS